MGGVLLVCCTRALEQTRHVAPELGGIFSVALALALLAGGSLLALLAVFRR